MFRYCILPIIQVIGLQCCGGPQSQLSSVIQISSVPCPRSVIISLPVWFHFIAQRILDRKCTVHTSSSLNSTFCVGPRGFSSPALCNFIMSFQCLSFFIGSCFIFLFFLNKFLRPKEVYSNAEVAQKQTH
jgi:hypothetical protein